MSQYVASLVVEDKEQAHVLAAALQETVDPTPDALTLFEHGTGWKSTPTTTTRPTGRASLDN